MKQKLSHLIFFLIFLLFCPIRVKGQAEDGVEQFQYKNIVLGVLVEVDSVPLLDGDEFREQFVNLINSTIVGINTKTLAVEGEGALGTTNGTRSSTITVFRMDNIFYPLEDVPEISVLFTLLGCEDTHFINKKITDRYGPVVHIAVTEAGCSRLNPASAITVPLTYLETNADLLQLLIDVRSNRILPGWKEAVIINDIESGDEIINVFGEGFSSNLANLPTITQTLYNVDSMSMKASFSDQIEEILDKYQKTAPGNYIVITKSANVNRVLEAASRTGMLSILKQWIFITPNPLEEEFSWDYIEAKIIGDGVNIAFIMNSSVSTVNVSNLLYCDTKALLVLLADVVETLAAWEFDLYLQVSNEEWEIIKPTRPDRVVNITASMTYDLSQRVLSLCDKNSSTWNLRAGENGQKGKQIFEVGWWNPLTGLRMTDDILPHVTGGFRGRKIQVASMHFPPWQIITRDVNGTNNVTYSGLLFEVLNHMAKDLNFTYQVLEPRTGETWGNMQSDGSWTGMMKMVAEGKVVIAAAAFTITSERAQYVNFTHVLEREAYGFMVNRPDELSRVLLFAAPFSFPVWVCIIITVVVVAPVLNLIHRYSWYYKFYGKVTEKGLYKMRNCYWYIYGSLLQQGGIHLPEALSGRMLIGFWWLFVIVTVTTYSGNLVAFLTFPKVESPVNSVDDLVHYRGVNSWGFLEGSVIEDHLKRSVEPQFEVMYKKAMKHPALNQTVFDLVTYQQHAYIDWKIVLLTAMRDAFKISGRCEFIIGAETFFEEKIALAVPKNSPYLPIFNKQISQMLQTGLLKKWKSRYWPGKDRCTMLTISAGNRKVGIGDVQGSFYLLFLGFFISLLVLAVEWLLFRRKKKKMIDTLKILVASNKTTQNFWGQNQFPFLQ